MNSQRATTIRDYVRSHGSRQVYDAAIAGSLPTEHAIAEGLAIVRKLVEDGVLYIKERGFNFEQSKVAVDNNGFNWTVVWTDGVAVSGVEASLQEAKDAVARVRSYHQYTHQVRATVIALADGSASNVTVEPGTDL